ncbi:hypothetical protein HEP_00502200, partial [Hepatocystis sp. ex Piliocolobus tephrosceles]
SMLPVRNLKFKERKGERSVNFIVYPSDENISQSGQNVSQSDQHEEDTNESNKINVQEETQQNEITDNNAQHNEIIVRSDGTISDKSNINYSTDPNSYTTPNSNHMIGSVVEQTPSEDDEKEMKNKEQADIEEFNKMLHDIINSAYECKNPQPDIELGSNDDPKIIREKYYKKKFFLDEADCLDDFVKEVVYKYVEGLCWVLAYYFQSCPMWHWHYPYYYAPLSSDLVICDITVTFTKDEPLLPFEQLLCVLPCSSRHCLPKSYQKLMLSIDSPISDFYPLKFQEQQNGMKYKYQWVVLLPFVDKNRILKHAEPLHQTLSKEEQMRNRRGLDKIYMNSGHILSKLITKSVKNYIKKATHRTIDEINDDSDGVKKEKNNTKLNEFNTVENIQQMDEICEGNYNTIELQQDDSYNKLGSAKLCDSLLTSETDQPDQP